MKLVKHFFIYILFAVWPCFVGAGELVGSISVSITSDTAATAKKMAFDEAYRQIIIDVIGPYSDIQALQSAVANEKTPILTGLVSSSSISGERQSDTTYSANITMTLNRIAVKDWLMANDVQNWLAITEDGGDKFLVVVDLKDKMSDWAQLRRVAFDTKVDLETQSIEDGRIVFLVPVARRGAFTIAVRENGWHYRNNDGNLNLFR